MITEAGGREEDGSSTSTTTTEIAEAAEAACDLHKSCDRCALKKRKCDGGNPCLRCIRMGVTCSFSQRRPRVVRPRPPPTEPVPGGSARGTRSDKPATRQVRRGASAALQQYGRRVSLKRCRLSPSPATGLVGMEENMFLSDYFGCVGFLPLTSQSDIRSTMVKMFAVNSSASVRYLNTGDCSSTEQRLDTIVPAGGRLPVDPSTCVFWSAVALGSLVKGRPLESVEKYTRLARDALDNVSGPPNAEVARALVILAYLSDFSGETDDFHVFVRQADQVLRDVQEEGSEILPVGLSDIVKHGETIKIFVGDVDREEVESFCNQERAVPQISDVATEEEICRYVLQSYRLFEQTMYKNVVEHRPTARVLGGDDEPSANKVPPDAARNDFDVGSAKHFVTSLIKEEAMETGYSGIVDMMMAMLRTHSAKFKRLEQAANRPDIREGIGGLIINGTLVFEKVAKRDYCGALDNLETCGAVYERYPGMCRFTMGLDRKRCTHTLCRRGRVSVLYAVGHTRLNVSAHISHMLLTNLVVVPDPRARVVYDKIRTAYNSTLFPGTPAIPPSEEWQGVAACCDNYNCRLMGFMVSQHHGDASSSPPPQEHAAEAQEKGPLNIPVDDRQQPGVSSPTGWREDTEGRNPAVVSHPIHNSGNAPTSNREGERVSDVAPIVDADVARDVDEQSHLSSRAELGAQAGKAAFSTVCGWGVTLDVDETVYYESIGVEDWLDVTQAMLDTNSDGLELDLG